MASLVRPIAGVLCGYVGVTLFESQVMTFGRVKQFEYFFVIWNL